MQASIVKVLQQGQPDKDVGLYMPSVVSKLKIVCDGSGIETV